MANLLKLNNISFTPHKNGATITDSVSLEIDKGDFMIIIGGNGSGKSTLLKLINRSYHHTDGEMEFSGQPISHYANKVLAQKIVTLSQFVRDSLFVKLTVQENADLLAMTYPIKRSKGKLCDYLADFNPKFTQLLKSPMYLLSGGEQQTLALALYLRHHPELLLLDEHTSALDPKTATKMLKFTADIINKWGVTCLMTTHHLDAAIDYGNRLIAIKNGKVIVDADTTEKTSLQKQDLLAYCY